MCQPANQSRDVSPARDEHTERNTQMRYTRAEHEEWLNEIGTPEDDKRSNGGRVPDHAMWGHWMRCHDPIAFNVSFNEHKQEMICEDN